MSKGTGQKIVVIVGPTASGKSMLAVQLAKKLSGEIVSADSRQVYKGLDIGTGKITKKEMAGIPHYLLNVASPSRTFTVAQYQKLGASAIKKILSKGKLPIIVGGTGFYIDALLYNYNLPRVLPNLNLRRALEKKSAEELFAKLKSLDPRRAKTIDRHNKRRLTRALEVIYTTGKLIPPLNIVKNHHSNILKNVGMITNGEKFPKFGVLKIGIKTEPAELKERIKKRLSLWLKQGLIKEVKNLHKQGLSWKKLDDFGLVYRFASRYAQKLISKEEMIKLLEQELWKYAKRQMTWFKRDKEIQWIRGEKEAEELVLNFLKN